jgi:hypothetical protein
MIIDCIREAVGYNAWRSQNLFIEYILPLLIIPTMSPMQPVVSEGAHITCPQAVVHLCVQRVLQLNAEHALVVWRGFRRMSPMQPVASEGTHVTCPQAVVHLCIQSVQQPHTEHAQVVWCVLFTARYVLLMTVLPSTSRQMVSCWRVMSRVEV